MFQLIDNNRYSRRFTILPIYFWRLTLLYIVSTKANRFLRFLIINVLIVLATPTLRASFCRGLNKGFVQLTEFGSTSARLYRRNELKMATYACPWMQWILCTVYVILICRVKFNFQLLLLLLQLLFSFEWGYFYFYWTTK